MVSSNFLNARAYIEGRLLKVIVPRSSVLEPFDFSSSTQISNTGPQSATEAKASCHRSRAAVKSFRSIQFGTRGLNLLNDFHFMLLTFVVDVKGVTQSSGAYQDGVHSISSDCIYFLIL